ncbi:hypothetical protein [Nocardia wallacei]|uniref:hypothetical protein n=1 Tax=Nocardia wallacei TaxID=480035 RepID=UPI00245412AA|nr:hypothetical protein [Nocardia wallacei]
MTESIPVAVHAESPPDETDGGIETQRNGNGEAPQHVRPRGFRGNLALWFW